MGRRAEKESQTSALIDLMAECQRQTSLESTEVGEELIPAEEAKVRSVLHNHQQMFSSRPGLTHKIVYKINTVGPQPTPSRAYQTTGKMKEKIHKEIKSI